MGIEPAAFTVSIPVFTVILFLPEELEVLLFGELLREPEVFGQESFMLPGGQTAGSTVYDKTVDGKISGLVVCLVGFGIF